MSERVTIKDVYEVVNRLEDKMDDKFISIDEKFEKVEARITKTETFQNQVVGIAGIVSIFSGAIATSIWNKIVGRQ